MNKTTPVDQVCTPNNEKEIETTSFLLPLQEEQDLKNSLLLQFIVTR
jgi:hypothetical protein